MILDGVKLKNGDKVYSIYRKFGNVINVTDTEATVDFNGMVLTVSAGNVMEGDTKVYGLGKPLVFWPKSSYTRDVSAYLPIIEALEQLK